MTTLLRPIPLPAHIAVAGVSFNQPAVASAYPGEHVTIVAEVNPHDDNACAVRGADGRLLGHVPRVLAPRFRAAMGPSETIDGVVEAVVGDETLGLRIRADKG